MEKRWSDEAETVDSDQCGNEKVSFDRLRPLLSVVASSIDVKVENWRSQDRIDYSVPGRRYIVIGGNVLARGLTLAGLVVSCFMRPSSKYDKLMQIDRQRVV